MNNKPMEYEMPPIRDVYYEQGKRVCCGKLSYKTACLMIACFEIVYWIYYGVLFLFAIIHHQKAWSVVFTGVNLMMLTIQIIILVYGTINENPRYLQTHLIFLILTFLWDIVLAAALLTLSILPKLFSEEDKSNSEAQGFGIVMGSILIVWFIARFFAIWIVYQNWKLLRALNGYGARQSSVES